MTYTAHITIMPLKELLDPQGKAVTESLHKLEFGQVNNVRIGKHITMQVEATDAGTAQQIAEDACKKLLANAVMESFSVRIEG